MTPVFPLFPCQNKNQRDYQISFTGVITFLTAKESDEYSDYTDFAVEDHYIVWVRS